MVPAIKKTGQKNRKKKQFGTSGFIFRFIGGIIFSLIIAGGVSALAVKVLGGTVALGIEFTGTAKTILLFGTFAVTFLISVGVIAYRLMRKITVKAKPAVKSAAPKSPQQPKKTKKTEMSLFAVAFVLVTRQFMMIAGALKTVNRPRNEEKAAAKTPAIPAASAAPAPPPAPVTPEVEEEPLSPESEKLKNYLMNFLTRAIGSDKNNPDTMDNFHRFGTSLYLAGASEVLTTHGQIAPHVHVKILADCLLTLKFKKSHAMSLAERYEEYLLADDRYMQMFQTGRKAIDVYLSDETTAGRLLDAALEEWGRPKTVTKESGPITVMLANIIPLTEAQNALHPGVGEQLNQSHSDIVGGALGQHEGMEVKRVPNGIMATFANTAHGVTAGLDMIAKAALSNQDASDLPLQMKVAIHAGVPNESEADLFGTVVRLAAQIVELAPADQIFIYEAVKDFFPASNVNFIDRGLRSMPGTEAPIKLFEALSRDGGAEASPAPTALEAAETVPSETHSNP